MRPTFILLLYNRTFMAQEIIRSELKKLNKLDNCAAITIEKINVKSMSED